MAIKAFLLDRLWSSTLRLQRTGRGSVSRTFILHTFFIRLRAAMRLQTLLQIAAHHSLTTQRISATCPSLLYCILAISLQFVPVDFLVVFARAFALTLP